MRVSTWIVAAVAAPLVTGCSFRASPEIEVRRVLDQQAAAWNRGDIDGYMAGYWKSPQLTFSSGGETREGWEATRTRYKARYPTPAEMGRLTFTALQFRPLGRQAMLVLGRWRLERADDAPEGNFSLVVEDFGGRWFITHDHSSVRPVAAGG